MEAFTTEPRILADRSVVAFCLVIRDVRVECAIRIAALEAHFWLKPDADDVYVLKTFRDGYARIRAAAERKALAYPDRRVELTPNDFAR